MSLTTETGDRIDLLLTKQESAVLSDEERTEISRLVATDAEARRYYIRGLTMMLHMREWCREEVAREKEVVESCVLPWYWRRSARRCLAVAACALVALGGVALWQVRTQGSSRVCTLVPRGAEWRYHKGLTEAAGQAVAWRFPEFDDSGWLAGTGPIGYGGSVGTELADMRGTYTSVFLRRTFRIQEPLLVEQLDLDVEYGGGFVAWINGQEVARVNVPGEPRAFLPHDAVAASGRAARWGRGLYGAEIPELNAGVNVLAVQVFNRSLEDSLDCFADCRLAMVPAVLPRAQDRDRDGLPDAWEDAVLGSRENDANGDADGDGMSNLQEYIAGTEAGDPERFFSVRMVVARSAAVVTVPTIQAGGSGYEGRTRYYALETFRPVPGGGEWALVPGYERVPGTGKALVHTMPLGELAQPGVFRARTWLERRKSS